MNLPSQEKAHKTIPVGCFFDDESGTRLGFMQLTSYGLIEDCYKYITTYNKLPGFMFLNIEHTRHIAHYLLCDIISSQW
jgi:hypothetical protein